MVQEAQQDFGNRLKRLEKAHTRGYRMEAPGTYGLSKHKTRRWLRIPLVAPTLFIFVVGLAFKVMLYHASGPEVYAQRLDRLASGTGLEQVSAQALQPDPLTIWISGELRRLRNR